MCKGNPLCCEGFKEQFIAILTTSRAGRPQKESVFFVLQIVEANPIGS